jgi:hypothetical protein
LGKQKKGRHNQRQRAVKKEERKDFSTSSCEQRQFII